MFPSVFSRGLNVWLQALATRVHWYQKSSTSNTKRKGENLLFHFAVSWRECTSSRNNINHLLGVASGKSLELKNLFFDDLRFEFYSY